jgi:hypothetical protein
MPASTPQGVPYVLPGDAIADYPVTSLDLAQWLDAFRERVPGAIASGGVAATIPINATVSPGVAVTYPVGRFAGPALPLPVVSANVGASGAWATVGAVSLTGFTAYLQARATITGAVFTREIYWIAQGV